MKTVLITGAAGGIGAATARRAAADGARVVLVDRLQPSRDIVPDGRTGAVECIALDVTDHAAVDALVTDLDQRYGGLSGAVLSHGLGGKIAPLTDYGDDEISAVLEVNLVGSLWLLRALTRCMTPRGDGRIVAVASAAAKEGNPNSTAYSASKAGLLGAVKSVAREVAQYGVLVNAVAPGPTDTPMLQQGPDLVDYVIARTPLGRLAQPEEVAAAIAWLLSPDCSFTTGSCLDVSGGRSAY